MEAIRTKDKLFLAIVTPIAIAAAYVWLWRTDAVRQVGSLEREEAALVTTEDFPIERQRARKLLEAAKEERAAEEKRPMPVAKVRANAGDGVAARELAVLEIFRESRLVVNAVSPSREEEFRGTRADEILRATGTRPNPVRRTYEVIGTYPAVLSALRTIHAREMAVIPECVAMPKTGHWSVTVCL